MTEWNASEYDRISALQDAMAEEVLALLKLQGNERVLDVGCGNGRITAQIAAQLPRGRVVGIDPSEEMVAFASNNFMAVQTNLSFEVADARHLPFREEFDLVVSFNALHWIPEQGEALRCLRNALHPDGMAQLRLVPKGPRTSLENVIEETRLSSPWSRYFEGFQDPYLHLAPQEYAATAEQNGFHILHSNTADKAWDFGSRAAFLAFGSVTFIEWTKRIPKAERPAFVADVLDRYRAVAGDEKTFRFYQMDVTLAAA